VAAFFDDSGELDPGSGHNIFCLGMVVMPVDKIRKVSEEWLNMIAGHLRLTANVLAVNGIEAKASDLHALRKKLGNLQSLGDVHKPFCDWGLNTPRKVDALIADIWEFLAQPTTPLIYLASVANKSKTLEKFQESEYQRFQEIQAAEQKSGLRNLRRELGLYVGERAFGWLLQRLNYMGNIGERAFADAFIIGDENAVAVAMYKSQALAQAGADKYTDLPKIVNNVWFGSSAHNPCLQIADWVAYAVRNWAEKRQAANMRLKGMLHNFRGYPDNVFGWGIVAIPDQAAFPKLPL